MEDDKRPTNQAICLREVVGFGVVFRRVCLIFVNFLIGRLSMAVTEYMKNPRNVMDWVGLRIDFFEFITKPRFSKRDALSVRCCVSDVGDWSSIRMSAR